MRPSRASWSKSSAIAQCFLRLSHLDPTLLDRLGSYEARLWRQAAQTIWTLRLRASRQCYRSCVSWTDTSAALPRGETERFWTSW
jgi:hypothetical protein